MSNTLYVLYHYFINEKYNPALKYVYLLCTGYFLWSVSYFFYCGQLHLKLTNSRRRVVVTQGAIITFI